MAQLKAGGGAVATPFIRVWLATGEPPTARVSGWVAALAPGGADNKPIAQLVAKYGAALRRECAAAGFVPHCDRPLRRQSPAAQAAAQRWAAAAVAAT